MREHGRDRYRTMVTKLENTPPVDPLSGLKDILEPWLRAVLHQELEKVLNGQSGDRVLTAEQAGEILGTSPDWLYRHASKLPFTRKLGPKMLRFSYQGIQKWLATRKSS